MNILPNQELAARLVIDRALYVLCVYLWLLTALDRALYVLCVYLWLLTALDRALYVLCVYL